MIKRFIIRGVSKKFKGIQKLKPQKTPKSTSGVTEQELAAKQFATKFGDKPKFYFRSAVCYCRLGVGFNEIHYSGDRGHSQCIGLTDCCIQ